MFDLGCAIVAEYGQRGVQSECFGNGFGKFDAGTDGDGVDVFRRTAYDNVADVAADGIAFSAKSVGKLAYCFEYLFFK